MMRSLRRAIISGVKMSFLMTRAKLNRIISRREGEMPVCEVCGEPMEKFIGENISSILSSSHIRRYRCPEHSIERNRI